MMKSKDEVSRRRLIELTSTTLAMAGLSATAAKGQDAGKTSHNAPNETDPGAQNAPLEKENPDSEWSPESDNGSVRPFKYPFDFSRKRVESGGWTRQVTVRDLPISTEIAGVEMRLTAGGVRELHWHVEAEWAIVLNGNARITAVNAHADAFVADVGEGDLWLFPPGVPHSIQGLGPDGCRFLLVFDDGKFDEFHTFLLTDWLAHTPKEVLAKNFNVPASTFDHVPKRELFIFQAELPGPLTPEQKQASEGTGLTNSYVARASKMPVTKETAGGHVKIIDSKSFPGTPITAAIVTLKPGGLRELHWHPNADEWQYYITGKARMTVFAAASTARTMDFEEGDVGYIPISQPHYIENTGDSQVVFLEIFKGTEYQDISLAEWLAHTPHLLVDQHLKVGQQMLAGIPKSEAVVRPL